MRKSIKYDVVGYWSEIKLDIVRKYAKAYSTIMTAGKKPSLHHIYIDAFAGPGVHISQRTGEYLPGSPLNALNVEPPFHEYHFIDLDQVKAEFLEAIAGNRDNVCVYRGDCNRILLESIFKRARYEDYKRALCLLDPYGLHLDWEAIQSAGAMKSVEIFLNFPVADMNRNVLWRDPQGVQPNQIERMNAYWGDDTWREVAYRPQAQIDLFEDQHEKAPNEEIAEAFRQRLIDVAGFDHVPKPLAMRNSNNAVVYYLFFASPKLVAGGIVNDIFKKYRHWR